MTLSALALAKAARRRSRRVVDGDDSGFILIYVLMIISIVTVLVGSTLVVSSSNVIPAVRTAYDQAAEAAAQGGINAFVAYADANCAQANSSVSTCTLATNFSGTVPIYSGSGYTSSYAWKADKDPQGRYFRVTSAGRATQGGLTATKTLVADVAGGASMNILDYGVVTGFETESPEMVLALNPQRSIALDSTAVANAGVPIKNNNVTWSGASPGVAAGKVAVCNATFNGKAGRATNAPPKAPNPYVDWTESTTKGNNYTDFQPCQTTFSHSTQLLAPVNPADGRGGYYSADALLLSNSWPGGSGPLFNQPVTTGWQYQSSDAGVCGTAPGQNFRSFSLACAGYPLEVGGSPSPSSTYGAPQYVATGPLIPTSSPTIPSGACVYNGPTRVKLMSDGTATVTSPQTTLTWVTASASGRPAQCYTGATATGMAAQSVSLTTPGQITVISVQNDGTPPPTTPAVAHGSSGWNSTGQVLGNAASTANSVFYLTSGTAGTTTASATTATANDAPYAPAVGDNPSTKTDAAWTPQWTSFTSGTTCSTATNTTDLKFFNCYLSSGSYSATAYSTFKSTVKAALTANAGNYATASTLQSYLSSLLAAGNSSDSANSAPSFVDNRSHRWKVTVAQDGSTTDGCVPATGVPVSLPNTPISAPTTDPLFASTTGNTAVSTSTDTSCLTATVTLQVGTCNVALVAGVCVNLGNYVWGNGSALLGGGQTIPQFKVTTTSTKVTTTTTVTSAVSSFPYMADVTQYSMGPATFGASGPGDLYVEGTATSTLALVAQNDVVVTGNLVPANTTAEAVEVIGQNNVRVYHPVKCRITDATMLLPDNTSAGFCPDDITGLYTAVLANGARPDQQYTNMRSDLAGLQITGAVFALGNSPASVTCPQPPGGGGICGGEFTADNFNRGDSVGTASLGTLTVTGTLAMSHHSPVGEEWEIPDVSGQTSRPNSGYQMAQRYQNLKALIAASNTVSNLLHTVTTTSSLWHVVSTSTGTGS